MRKMFLAFFTLFMTIVLNCINAQEKEVSYTYEKYGIINQYTNNMVLEVNDILRFSKHKLENENCFIVNINDLSSSSENSAGFVLVIALKSYDELNEQYVYIGDAIEVISEKESLIYKGKCLVKSKNKLDIYLNNQGYNYEETYNNALSFSVNFYNMKTDEKGYIPQIPNKFIRIFPIRNKTEQEKREQAEIRDQKIKEQLKIEEQKKQAENKRKEEVEKILLTVNEEKIDEYVREYFENKLIKESEYWDILKEPQRKNIKTIANVKIYVDSLNTNVVSIGDDIINERLNTLYWNSSQTHYCTINGTDYSKCHNSMFYNKKMDIETKTLEKGVYGVEKRKGKFKYYEAVPNEIQEWCESNITQNGFHSIQYINYNGKYTIKLINVTKDIKKVLQGKEPQKAKKVWRTIGSIGGSILLLGGLIALKAI